MQEDGVSQRIAPRPSTIQGSGGMRLEPQSVGFSKFELQPSRPGFGRLVDFIVKNADFGTPILAQKRRYLGFVKRYQRQIWQTIWQAPVPYLCQVSFGFA